VIFNREARRREAETHIREAMADPGPYYGYPLSRATRLRPGRLYPALARMEARGEIVSGWDDPPSARRWYRLAQYDMQEPA
jgi:DNA-binding PadR family transcriptional regulator